MHGRERESPLTRHHPRQGDSDSLEDRLSGWSNEADADELVALTEGESGESVGRLSAPGTAPLVVLGQVRVIERFRSVSGGLGATPARPAGLRGAPPRQGRRAGWSATPWPTPDRGSGDS
ncbi:hypothetical protein [Streptomyces sp. NBC_00539]|uniref:hypothetical protein n=1 Tax=Streptomyces sp. NBC_00539 TaxID=2975770 RepID=UPI002E7FC7F8|nr:hypothetical protein [Streptomyces sp. NBC_00539]WUC62910.1 hypothetical protein OG861_01120 [Streptomyces sp. NBC_00539]